MSHTASKRNAGQTPLSQRKARKVYSERGRYPDRRRNTTRRAPARRIIVPMLEELAALVPGEQLESVRRQVQPGEHVAVYRSIDAEKRGRLIIVGPERTYLNAPRSLEDRWLLAGEVAITDDAETSLPIVEAA